jgi:hypothetical protein
MTIVELKLRMRRKENQRWQLLGPVMTFAEKEGTGKMG